MLSIWQIKRQLAFLAAQATWPDSPNGLVYTGGAFVSEQLEGMFRLGSMTEDGPVQKVGTTAANGMTPFCRVSCTGARWDQRSNGARIDRAKFRLYSSAGGGSGRDPGATTSTGFDTHGINQASGALRQSAGTSPGRDVDELISAFIYYHGSNFYNGLHGFDGQARVVTEMVPVDGVQVLRRALEIEVFNVAESNQYPSTATSLISLFGSNGVGIASPILALPAAYNVVTTTAGYATAVGTPHANILVRYSASAAPVLPTDGSAPSLTALPNGTAQRLFWGSLHGYFSLWFGSAETPAALAADTPDTWSNRVTWSS